MIESRTSAEPVPNLDVAPAGDDTRVRLLTSAGEIFAEKGFRATTVREICSAAGASIAAVNYHFGDKEGLYVATVEHAFCSRKLPGAPPIPESWDASRRLHFFIYAMTTSILDPSRPAWHARLMLREMSHPTSAGDRLVDSYIRPMSQILGSIVEQLIDPAVDDPKLVCFSVVGQILYHRVHRPVIVRLIGQETYDSYSLDRIAAHIAAFSLRAMGRPADARDLEARSAEMASLMVDANFTAACANAANVRIGSRRESL